MSWTIQYSDSLRCVECSFSGVCTNEDIRDATSRAIATGRECQAYNYLVDTSQIDYKGTIFTLFDLPANQYEDEGLHRESRIAIVLPANKKSKEDALFYETASVNRGWNVKSFESRLQAIDWLRSSEAIPPDGYSDDAT